MYDRVLQLTQQILEMLKSMVSMFQASKVPIQPIVHGSWMDVRQLREKGIASDLVVVL